MKFNYNFFKSFSGIKRSAANVTGTKCNTTFLLFPMNWTIAFAFKDVLIVYSGWCHYFCTISPSHSAFMAQLLTQSHSWLDSNRTITTSAPYISLHLHFMAQGKLARFCDQWYRLYRGSHKYDFQYLLIILNCIACE